jgi:hypothetical protein
LDEEETRTIQREGGSQAFSYETYLASLIHVVGSRARRRKEEKDACLKKRKELVNSQIEKWRKAIKDGVKKGWYSLVRCDNRYTEMPEVIKKKKKRPGNVKGFYAV